MHILYQLPWEKVSKNTVFSIRQFSQVPNELNNVHAGDFPGGPVTNTPCSPVQRAQVQSLAGELDLACYN